MDESFFINGIDVDTGQYFTRPFSAEEAIAGAKAEKESGLADGTTTASGPSQAFRGLPDSIKPHRLDQTGWAVVFTPDSPPEIREALSPLIEHRREQVPDARRFKVDTLSYEPGDRSAEGWLARYGVYPGSVAPTKVPYYVLLIGGPESIPFDFQYALDIEYAVGRLAFDTPEEYRNYANSVVAYETQGTVPNAREVVYWGTRHDGDLATMASADSLITPLYSEGEPEGEPPVAEGCEFSSRCFLGPEATKARLSALLNEPGPKPPSVLFTASHGAGVNRLDVLDRQRALHGSLIGQEWAGIGRPVTPDQYLAAADLVDGRGAGLPGLVVFLFACFGAGTPQHDDFLINRAAGPEPIAERAFVASLPQRMLSHPNGGALAVIGHVERAWPFVFKPKNMDPQLTPFRNCLSRILNGLPVGHATGDINRQYSILAALLSNLLDATKPAIPGLTPYQVAMAWMQRNEARNYILLGDPAVRLRVDDLS